MAEEFKALTKIRVTNITRNKNSAGKFLDPGTEHGNKLIAPGRSILFDCPGGHIPECVQSWKDKDFVSIHNAVDGELISGPIGGEISPGLVSPLREASGTQDFHGSDENDLFDEEPNLNDAMEAAMPSRLPFENTKPIKGDLRQGAHVSLGSRDEGSSGDLGRSPIPGETPRDLDNTAAFTVKAPRSHAVGQIVGKGK